MEAEEEEEVVVVVVLVVVVVVVVICMWSECTTSLCLTPTPSFEGICTRSRQRGRSMFKCGRLVAISVEPVALWLFGTYSNPDDSLILTDEVSPSRYS